MLSTKARPITRHEYAMIPVGAPNYQLIEGDLVPAPSPGSYHQEIAGRIDVYLSDINVYQPDIFFVGKQNVRIIKEHGVEGAPDLVIEILSKGSDKYELGPKRAVYARSGVEELWIVDPAKRALSVFRLAESSDTPLTTYKSKQTFTSEMLPGLTIDLAGVFAS